MCRELESLGERMKRTIFGILLASVVAVAEAKPGDKLYHVNVHGRGAHTDKTECIRLAKADYDENYLKELKLCAAQKARLQRAEAKVWQDPASIGWACYFWTLQRCVQVAK